jgi:hypothetical protein
MSVLSNPQGTPERVWSLVAGLAALGGSTSRASYDELLNPGYQKGGAEWRAKDTLAANAHGAASSLKLVDAGRDHAKLLIEPPPSYAAFADHVHDYLISLSTGDPDAPILEAFAWVAAESDRRSQIEWIYRSSREEFADQANSALVGEDEDGKLMNPTKAVAWRRWLSFLGLGVVLPLERTYDFPTPIDRILRELTRGGLSPGTLMGADQLVAWIAARMPYLDRGRLYIQACQRIAHTPAVARLSPILSAALRDLHDDGSIHLRVSGDAAERLRLTEDSSHPIDAFTAVTIFPTPTL